MRGKFSEVRAHGIEQSNLRQELESVNYATVVPKNSCLPDTQEVVSHREDLTTVPEPVIYCECRPAIETVPPDIFDGQSVHPRIGLGANIVVIALHKGLDINDLSDYRPISMLPILLKG